MKNLTDDEIIAIATEHILLKVREPKKRQFLLKLIARWHEENDTHP